MNWKKFGKALLYPHLAVLILLTPIAIAFLVFSLIYFDENSIIAIISYMLAFYVLLVYCCRIPRIINFFKKVKNENRYIQRYLQDVNLRMNISLYGSLIWNGAFAVFQLWLGFFKGSIWFFAMFGYYIILAIMRFFLLNHTRNYKANEQYEIETKKYCLCGWLLLLMNLALSVIIFFIVYWNKTFVYNEIITITLAAYTFTTFTFAIINVFRYKKYNSPVYSAAKIISFIAACVSMITLETTMLTAFGKTESSNFSQIMLAISGSVVVVAAITVSIYMIIKSMKQLKNFNKKQAI